VTVPVTVPVPVPVTVPVPVPVTVPVTVPVPVTVLPPLDRFVSPQSLQSPPCSIRGEAEIFSAFPEGCGETGSAVTRLWEPDESYRGAIRGCAVIPHGNRAARIRKATA